MNGATGIDVEGGDGVWLEIYGTRKVSDQVHIGERLERRAIHPCHGFCDIASDDRELTLQQGGELGTMLGTEGTECWRGSEGMIDPVYGPLVSAVADQEGDLADLRAFLEQVGDPYLCEEAGDPGHQEVFAGQTLANGQGVDSHGTHKISVQSTRMGQSRSRAMRRSPA